MEFDKDTPRASSAQAIVRALGGRNGRARCPVHNGKSLSLSISDGDNGKLLLHCFAGCEYRVVRDALIARGLLPDRNSRLHIIPPRVVALRKPKLRWSQMAQDLWTSYVRPEGTLVETYLRSRRCWVPGLHDVRFGEWRGRPAMICRITDALTNASMSLHHTLLRHDGTGKADVARAKLVLEGHAIKGGVIRLCPDDAITNALGLAEGVENALTAIADGWRPVWSTVDSNNLRCLPLLPHVDRLTIFYDPGTPGIGAASTCYARWWLADREAQLVGPVGCDDWNAQMRKCITPGPREAADRAWTTPAPDFLEAVA